MSRKIAIVAALEREIEPLVRHWRLSLRDHDGRRFKFFESDRIVVVCGGVGAHAARRACEAIIALYQPTLVVSAGFAGALEPGIKPGSAFTPRTIINAQDGSRTDVGLGSGTLITVDSVAGPEQKSRLAITYAAQAVDMEAAAVARGAQARGIPFRAIKAISDGPRSVLPPLDRFVGHDGQLQTAKLVAYVAIRPLLWRPMLQLARQSFRASNTLCQLLDQFNHTSDDELDLHPTGVAANH